MALVLEDGTGLSNADTYATLAEAEAYAVLYGIYWPSTKTDAEKEQALRRAALWLDATYRSTYLGVRINGMLQSLEWSRDLAYYRTPPYAQITGVPINLKNAQIEAASRELQTPGSMSPAVSTGKQIKKVAIQGSVSVEYVDPGGVAGQRLQVPAIDAWIAPLLGEESLASPRFSEAVRY